MNLLLSKNIVSPREVVTVLPLDLFQTLGPRISDLKRDIIIQHGKSVESAGMIWELVQKIDLDPRLENYLKLFSNSFVNSISDLEQTLRILDNQEATNIIKTFHTLINGNRIAKECKGDLLLFLDYIATELGIKAIDLNNLANTQYGNQDIRKYLKGFIKFKCEGVKYWDGFNKLVNIFESLPDSEEVKKSIDYLANETDQRDYVFAWIAKVLANKRNNIDLPEFSSSLSRISKLEESELNKIRYLFVTHVLKHTTIKELAKMKINPEIIQFLSPQTNSSYLNLIAIFNIFTGDRKKTRNSNQLFLQAQVSGRNISQTVYNRVSAANDRITMGTANSMFLPDPTSDHPAIVIGKHCNLNNFLFFIKDKIPSGEKLAESKTFQIESESKQKILIYGDKLEVIQNAVNKSYDYESFSWYEDDQGNPDFLKKHAICIGVNADGSPIYYALAKPSGIEIVSGCISIFSGISGVKDNPWWVGRYGFENITGHREMLSSQLGIKEESGITQQKKKYFDFSQFFPDLPPERINEINTRAALPSNLPSKEAILVLPTLSILDSEKPIDKAIEESREILELLISSEEIQNLIPELKNH